jgi:hypothetical protein
VTNTTTLLTSITTSDLLSIPSRKHGRLSSSQIRIVDFDFDFFQNKQKSEGHQKGRMIVMRGTVHFDSLHAISWDGCPFQQFSSGPWGYFLPVIANFHNVHEVFGSSDNHQQTNIKHKENEKRKGNPRRTFFCASLRGFPKQGRRRSGDPVMLMLHQNHNLTVLAWCLLAALWFSTI